MTNIDKTPDNKTLTIDAYKNKGTINLRTTNPQIKICDWHAPTELCSASFVMQTKQEAHEKSDTQPKSEKPSQYDNQAFPSTQPHFDSNPNSKQHLDSKKNTTSEPSQPENTEPKPASNQSQTNNIIEKLLPLVSMFNNGGFDIATVLNLLDKSGQGLGALGKLLPIITPLLGGFKKKSTEDTIDYKTINLDN